MIYNGNARLQGGNAKQMHLVITQCTDLVGMSVNSATLFNGVYDPATKTAVVNVPSANFADLKNQLAGGALVPITLTVDANNDVTQFCYNSTCLSASAGLTAAVVAERVITEIPISSVTTTSKPVDTSATGTE